jgi:L-ascorbate metabolism protein UlaG (beta-lactamase superfamily)
VALIAAASTGCSATLHSKPPTPVHYGEPPLDAITFWGHACAYIDVGGYGIVTDPVFSRKYATIRRRLITSPPYSSYDQTRVILISHAHQDHLDPQTLWRFPAKAEILAPAPSAEYLRKHGFKARVMRPGDTYEFPGGTITAVAAHHPGSRMSLKARSDGRAIGYVIRTPSETVYYTGDTEYFSGIRKVGAKYHPDIVLMNLNAHLHSGDAVAAIRDLGVPTVIPIHYGAYNGKMVRLGPQWRAELMDSVGQAVVPLEVGQSYSLTTALRSAR